VLFTPGHTKTNISLWVPSDGVLYCGDCLVHLYLANLDASEPVDWPVWLQSIERIRGLGAKTIVCGHGPVAAGTQVASIIDRVANELNDAIARGSSPTAAGS
jgi:glyoxylase-like metal-dependent hydrolase (beta-lactamase superfamily II)